MSERDTKLIRAARTARLLFAGDESRHGYHCTLKPTPSSIPAGSIQSRTDFGKPGYGGPCPPAGDKPHRYQITLYALKTDKPSLGENAPAAMVGFYPDQNLFQKTVLKAQYGR